MKTKENMRGTVSKVLNLTHKIVPGYITFVFIVKLIAAGQPFVSIYFSSLILDGLFRLDSFESSAIFILTIFSGYGLIPTADLQVLLRFLLVKYS